MPETRRQKNLKKLKENKKPGLVKKKMLLFFHILDLKNDLHIKLFKIKCFLENLLTYSGNHRA